MTSFKWCLKFSISLSCPQPTSNCHFLSSPLFQLTLKGLVRVVVAEADGCEGNEAEVGGGDGLPALGEQVLRGARLAVSWLSVIIDIMVENW